MKNLFLGIDVGGTFIKLGIVDENNQILAGKKFETTIAKNGENFAETLFSLIKEVLSLSKFKLDDLKAVGIGISGLIDSKNGIVLSTPILNLVNYPLAEKLGALINLPVKVANDADVATLSEQWLGVGKVSENFIMLTLGTGIGGGIVLNGKNLGIAYNVPFEVGHFQVSNEQVRCKCGRYGCYELFASTKSLVCQTKQAMSQNPNSAMWKKYNLSNVNGKTVFEFLSDFTAKEVLKEYIKHLGNGIINLVNIFKPEYVVIGGAISSQKDNLIKPLETFVNKHSLLKSMGYSVKIVPACFVGDAGIIGTRFLFY